MDQPKLTFEEALQQLETIAEQVEAGKIGLGAEKGTLLIVASGGSGR